MRREGVPVKTMAEVVDRSVRRTLANFETWKDWTVVVDSTGRRQRTKRVEDRFWAKVDIGAQDECWEWQGSRLKRSSHGLFLAGDQSTTAHRMAYASANGNIPPDTDICHRCDNPPCCNPAHLFPGDALINMRDCVSKGRMHHGTRTGGHILNEAQVKSIRSTYASGALSQEKLGKLYGVDQNTIWKVVHRVTWRHVA
jgi:hypothetical protein